jgi:hypothetical protein
MRRFTFILTFIALWAALAGSDAAISHASTAAVMVSPAPGSTLSGSTVTFTWTAGTGNTKYDLWVGNAFKTGDLYDRTDGPGTSQLVTGLPTDGRILHVQLVSSDGTEANTFYQNYTYTASGGTKVAAAITSPAGGTTLSGSSVTFAWSAGSGGGGVSSYYLEVGDSTNSGRWYGGSAGTSLSQTVTTLPTDGASVLVTVYTYYSDGSYLATGKTYAAATVSRVAAAITSPAGGTTLSGSSVTFAWAAGSGGGGVSSYYLEVGDSTNSGRWYGGSAGPSLSQTVTTLPTDGSSVLVTLYTYYSDASYLAKSYRFTALKRDPGLLLSPAQGTVFVGDAGQTFTWSAAGGSVLNYRIFVGDRRDSQGNAAAVLQAQTTDLSRSFSQVRCFNSRSVAVDLITTWTDNTTARRSYDFAQTCSSTSVPYAVITSPAQNASLSGNPLTIEWKLPSVPYNNYLLRIGTSFDGEEVLAEKTLPFSNQGYYTTPSGVPADRPVYVRLGTVMSDGNTYYSRASYNAGAVPPPPPASAHTPAQVTSPTVSTVLTGSSLDLHWNDGAPGVFFYYLEVGWKGQPGGLFDGSVALAQSQSVPLVPTLGNELIVTLYTCFSTSTADCHDSNTYLYRTNKLAGDLTAPNASGPLAGPSVPFSWSAGAGGVSGYTLEVGTTPGGSDVFAASFLPSVRSQSVDISKVATGSTVYVTLYTLFEPDGFLDRGYSFSVLSPPSQGCQSGTGTFFADFVDKAFKFAGVDPCAEYANGTKYWAYAGADAGPQGGFVQLVSVGIQVYVDLADYVGATPEGRQGWVTVNITATASAVGVSLKSALPVGLVAGIAREHVGSVPDAPRLGCTFVNASAFLISGSLLGEDAPSLVFSLSTNFGVSLIDCEATVLLVEVDRSIIDNMFAGVTSTLIPGFFLIQDKSIVPKFRFDLATPSDGAHAELPERWTTAMDLHWVRAISGY